ncbi:MAG: hypothetical protein QOH16_708 [Gaiellaceae bacterium]|nr:hypothetical protein [Gaiellaceae bacterium]
MTAADDDVPAERHDGLSERLLQELFALRAAADLRSLLAARPELVGALVRNQLRELAAAPAYSPGFERLLSLLTDADTDIDAAWAEYERLMNDATAVGDKLADVETAVREALDGGDIDGVLELTASAIPRPAAAGLGVGVSMLRELRGLAFLRRQSSDRIAEVENGITELERARVLAPPGATLASVLMHLAFAYSERLRGDRADNAEAAVEMLSLSVLEVADADAPDLAAMVDTNFAFALMHRARGDRVENLREAVGACERALTHRSLERNAVDRAYSQLNLGDAVDQPEIARGEDGVSGRLKEPHEEVVRSADAMPEKWRPNKRQPGKCLRATTVRVGSSTVVRGSRSVDRGCLSVRFGDPLVLQQAVNL